MIFGTKEKKLDTHEITTKMLSLIINDQSLSLPVYLPQIKSEDQAAEIGLGPLVYIWNEDRTKGTFSVSVNGQTVAHLLESIVHRKHSQFNEIRDEIMSVLSKTSQAMIINYCEESGAFPSEIFGT